MAEDTPKDTVTKGEGLGSGTPEVSVTEVARNFSEYLDRVVHRGEDFTLVRRGRPVAHLAPVPRGSRLGDLSDLLERIPRLDPSEAEALGRDIDSAREELDARPLEDRWGS